jgi:hypothetical protein
MKVKKKIAIWPVEDRLERLRIARQGAERPIQHRVDQSFVKSRLQVHSGSLLLMHCQDMPLHLPRTEDAEERLIFVDRDPMIAGWIH